MATAIEPRTEQPARAPEPPSRGRRRLGRPGAGTYLLLGIAVALAIFPFYWMLVVATTGTAALARIPPPLVPGPNFLAHAEAVFARAPFLVSLLNSVLVSVAVTASVLFFCTLAGFAFAKLRFKGRNGLFVVVIATLMVPTQLGIVPLYMIMAQLGWVDSLRAVIVPGMVTAFGVFWMRQFIAGAVPDELLEAGRVDGCSTFRLFRHVVVPAVRPAAAVLGLLTFMNVWNDFFWPLVVLRQPRSYTVQIALAQLNDAYTQDYGVIMAGTIMATLPLLLVFLLFGRQIIGGIMQGALKG